MDRLFGTYRPYFQMKQLKPVSADLPKETPKDERQQVLQRKRPEAIPSPWSFLALMVLLLLALAVIEAIQLGTAQTVHSLAVFVKSAIVLVNLALVAAAIEAGFSEEMNVESATDKKIDEVIFHGKRTAEAMPAGFTKDWSSSKGVFQG